MTPHDALLNPIYWIAFLPIGIMASYYIYFKLIPSLFKDYGKKE